MSRINGYFAMCFLGTIIVATSGLATDWPPNGDLTIAYRQLTEGKLSEGVHHISLSCSDGRCSITTLSLNQCGPSSRGKAFYPQVVRTSTEEGTLWLKETVNGELSAEEKYSGATFKYRFTYKVRQDPELSNMIRSKQTRWFGDLTGFSGAVVKDSSILGKIISWQLIPLKGRFPRVEAACPMMLDGVP
jgi:hypothetical protein